VNQRNDVLGVAPRALIPGRYDEDPTKQRLRVVIDIIKLGTCGKRPQPRGINL